MNHELYTITFGLKLGPNYPKLAVFTATPKKIKLKSKKYSKKFYSH